MISCFGIRVNTVSKQVCLELEIDNANENPVTVVFRVCQETVQAQATLPVGQPGGNPPQVCATYTTGPGPCTVTATATGATGSTCSTQDFAPVV